MKSINPNLTSLPTDYLYHLGLNTDMPLKEIFGDVRYVCMSGSADRAKVFAQKMVKELHLPVTPDLLKPYGKTERYFLYKVGPVISVSHGMGAPSCAILLHEITKLMHYAGCQDPIYFRIGTSGGLGLNPGTVVLTQEALNGELKPVFRLPVMGKVRKYSACFDRKFNQSIYECRGSLDVVMGKTLCVDCFYEGQARLDGALDPQYTEKDKAKFLKRLYVLGVRNIEMESSFFAAFCSRAGIRGAVVCTTLLDRLKGDQVTSTPEQLAKLSDNSQQLVINFIKAELKI